MKEKEDGNMKRVIWVAGLLALFLFSPPARADSGLTLTASVDPSSLYQPGTVTITAEVENTTSTDAANLVLQVDGQTVPFPTVLKAGKSESYTGSLTIEWEDFGADIPVSLTWEQGGVNKSTSKSVTVTRIPSDPKLTMERTVDKDLVVLNDNIIITYVITNTGKIDADNVTIRDTGMGIIKNLGSILAGASQTYTQTLKVTRSLTSAPVVNCDAAQSNYSFLPTVESLKITMLNPKLTVKLEASSDTVTAGEAVTLVLTVTNTGDVDFGTLEISEPLLGSPFESSSLAVGAIRTFSQKVVPSGNDVRYQFTIKVTGASTGRRVFSYKSPEIKITISEADAPAMLTLFASSEVLRLTEPGEVQIILLLENTGKDTLAGVSVYEESLGLIRSFDKLPTGQNTFSCTVMVEETKTYRFYARVTDETGTEREFYSEGISIEYAAVTASPDSTPAPPADPFPTGTGPLHAEERRTSFWQASPALALLLVLLAVAAVAAAVGLIVYSARMNRRVRRRLRKSDPRRTPVRTASYTTSVSRADSPSVVALREGRIGAALGDTLQFRRIVVPEETIADDDTQEFTAIKEDEVKE